MRTGASAGSSQELPREPFLWWQWQKHDLPHTEIVAQKHKWLFLFGRSWKGSVRYIVTTFLSTKDSKHEIEKQNAPSTQDVPLQPWKIHVRKAYVTYGIKYSLKNKQQQKCRWGRAWWCNRRLSALAPSHGLDLQLKYCVASLKKQEEWSRLDIFCLRSTKETMQRLVRKWGVGGTAGLV